MATHTTPRLENARRAAAYLSGRCRPRVLDRDHLTCFPSASCRCSWSVIMARGRILTGLGRALTVTRPPRLVNLSAVVTQCSQILEDRTVVRYRPAVLVCHPHYDIHSGRARLHVRSSQPSAITHSAGDWLQADLEQLPLSIFDHVRSVDDRQDIVARPLLIAVRSRAAAGRRSSARFSSPQHSENRYVIERRFDLGSCGADRLWHNARARPRRAHPRSVPSSFLGGTSRITATPRIAAGTACAGLIVGQHGASRSRTKPVENRS